jgi:SET domain-containing protein
MLLIKTRLGPSTIHGIGVFADEDIPKGKLVWSFNPLIDRALTREEIEGLPALAQEFIKIYGFYRDDKCVLCGDYGKFVNHSSTPNLEPPEDESFALRDIKRGEELTEDYDNYDDEPQS